jgi:two-component system phosphate regulon sensor histidine kinase PhoR
VRVAKRRLLWQIFPSYLLITFAALCGAGWFASSSLHQFYDGLVSENLTNEASWLGHEVGPRFRRDNAAELKQLCDRFAKASNSRVTLILPDGEVVYDSSESPERLQNHAHRPEVRAALNGEVGHETRFSESAEQRMKYVALPIRADGNIIGVIRTALPSTALDAALSGVRRRIAIGGGVVALLAALLSLWMSRRISQPLEEMRQSAEHFSRGDLSHKIPIPDSYELSGLAENLNAMALQLDERIQLIVRQGHEQEAVLASMVEGVLAVDTDERIISLNHAASRLLGSQLHEAQGRSLQEVIRNADLRRFVASALSCKQPIEGDVILHGNDRERTLQANGTALRDPSGGTIGAVIVLNDVSRLRQLESMRRDFAANVSHELKTPITSIKGFVETLLDGAINNPADAERFLRIIARQADRLNAIIEDLLALSKIEKEAETTDIALEIGPLENVLDAAWHDCETLAAEREIQVEVQCPSTLRAAINPPLLQQAVVNLLDNAIKYSDPHSVVRLTARALPGEVAIYVQDQGCGIESEHLPRLFERFYRVDRARSRKVGGTGLGLAIVKHIVHAHRGRITVESAPGKGSTFVIYLPSTIIAERAAG